MCARAAHDLSARRDKAFVAVNCAAMPENLAESELFGYVKGAFTGAAQDRHGLFVEADGGTLFLDEVGSATPQLQSSLLRAIQEGEIRPVGSTVPRKVDVRLICATSCDLEAMVDSGEFRKDLYFRINVVSLTLPPLRDRREDVSLLAQEFLNRLGRKNRRQIEALAPEALVALERYDWPGNVRELENAVEHAILFTPPESPSVPVQALPARILAQDGTPGSSPAADGLGLDAMIGVYEREIVKATLDRCGWNQSEAARVLQVSEKRIRNRIREFGLRRNSAEIPASN
jgi:transcriptional regulator with GAF, ATPase, and Fis domain